MATSRSVLWKILIAVVAAAALAGAWFGFFALRRRVASRTWTLFAACLAGPRLAETDSAEVRVRRVWMSAKREVAAAGGPWPERCLVPAHDLAHSWAVRALVPALPPIAERVADEIDEGAALYRSGDVELLWATAYALPWDDAVAASVAAPPLPEKPLIDDPELRALRRTCSGNARLLDNGVDPRPPDSILFPHLAALREWSVCAIGASPSAGALGAIRCAPFNVDRGPWRATEPLLADIADARGRTREQWQSCRTKSATAIVVTRESSGTREEIDIYLTKGKGVSEPQRLVREVLDPKHVPKETLGPLTVACGDEDVRLSWASGTATGGVTEHRLWFARCMAASCTTETAKITGLQVIKMGVGTAPTSANAYSFVASPLVLDLGAKAALLWDRGDAIAVRVAAKGDLQGAPERTVIETYNSSVTERELPGAAAIAMPHATLVVRGDAAIAFLPEHVAAAGASQRDSTFRVRIGGDGSVRALPCEGGN